MSKKPRPRLFLDLDGVVNSPAPGWDDVVIFTVSDSYGSGYIIRYTVTVARALVAAIDRLRDDFDLELVILSTWLENPEMIDQLTAAVGGLAGGRLLSIPARNRGGYVSATWKLDALIADLADGPVPFIWADDNEVPIHGAFVATALDVPSLLIAPDQKIGLARAHLAAMRTFLEGLE